MTEQKLPANWTMARLIALTPKDRFKLLESTKNTKLGTSEDRANLVAAILDSGSLFDSSAITAGDPVALEMDEIINSPEGRSACLDATMKGLPALAGVEPMIVKSIGEFYAAKYMATQWAGYQVGTLMKELGYEETGKKAMPPGSVAKTAAFWEKIRR